MNFLVMLWWGNAKEEVKWEEGMDKHLQIAFSMTGLWSTILFNPDTVSTSRTLYFTEEENEALRSWANLSKCVQLVDSWSGIQTRVSSALQPLHFLCPRLCPCDCLDGGHPALGTAGAEQAAQSLWPHAEFPPKSEAFHRQQFKPWNRLWSVWGFPTRNKKVRCCLIGSRIQGPSLAQNRNSSVTASGVAPGLQKWLRDPLLEASVPIWESQSLWAKLNGLFIKSKESFLWHKVQISCPVPVTSWKRVEAPPDPSPVPTISTHSSGFLLVWGESLLLIFWIWDPSPSSIWGSIHCPPLCLETTGSPFS